MKATIVCRRFLFVFSILVMSSVPAFGQAFSASDAEQLKAQVNSQQKMLQKQEAHIEAIESALAEQQRILAKLLEAKADGAVLLPAVERSATAVKPDAYKTQTVETLVQQEQQPLSSQAQNVED